MSSPESTSPTPEEPRRRRFGRRRERHLHLVEDTPATPEEDVMVGFSREVKRDKSAIEEFIRVRDYHLSKKYSLDQAILKAAVAYETTIGSPLENWGPDPEAPSDPGHSAGLYGMEITLPKVEPSESFVNAVDAARATATAQAEEHYRHNGTPEGRQETLDNIDRKYGGTRPQGQRTLNDRELYATYDETTGERQLHWGTIEDRGTKVKEQLDAHSPAIEASSAAIQAALTEGKSLDEAYDIGAEEYNRILAESGDLETTPEGRRQAAAIHAFNEQRDVFVPKDLRNVKFDRAKALHLAANKYSETLEHVEHLGHENHDSIFSDGHHDEHVDSASHPTEGSQDSSNQETEEDVEKEKVSAKLKRFGKNVLSTIKTFSESKENRSLMLRHQLYKINDAFGNAIDATSWLFRKTANKAGLNNDFIDWRNVLHKEAEGHEETEENEEINPEPHETPQSQAEEHTLDIAESTLRNWNYRATPQKKHFMPEDWPGNEFETPGYQNVLLFTPATLINEFGLNIPEEQMQPTLDYLNDKMLNITRDAILDEIGEDKLEEFDRLPKGPNDEDALMEWIDTNIPTLPERIEREFTDVLSSEDFEAFQEFLNRRARL